MLRSVQKKNQILIVAGEASGDLHGANLIRALKHSAPDLSISAMGGSEMKAAGAHILHDISSVSVMGFTEVLGKLGEIRRVKVLLERFLETGNPGLLILIDYPGLNLMLAKKARKLHIPVLYYISPKVWAWRSSRVQTIKKYVDRMAVILPFEKQFYQQYGYAVDFVGNPLLDSVKTSCTVEEFRRKHDIPSESRVVGILPGSRRQELAALLPVFLDAASLLQKHHDDLVFLLPLAPTLTMGDLQHTGLKDSSLDIRVISDDRYDLMAACDVAMAASGTVTLELAVLGIPMIVAYKLSPVTWFLAQRLVKLEFASLVNLVADREVVPELLQDRANGTSIAAVLGKLLNDERYFNKMRQGLADVCSMLGQPGASERTARIALKMMQQR
jgi:lipid-A-disaccharide synthase